MSIIKADTLKAYYVPDMGFGNVQVVLSLTILCYKDMT